MSLLLYLPLTRHTITSQLVPSTLLSICITMDTYDLLIANPRDTAHSIYLFIHLSVFYVIVHCLLNCFAWLDFLSTSLAVLSSFKAPLLLHSFPLGFCMGFLLVSVSTPSLSDPILCLGFGYLFACDPPKIYDSGLDPPSELYT